MADITMCKGENCPVRKRCYRYNAEPEKYQSYFVDSPGKLENNVFTCDMYWGKGSDSIMKQIQIIIE